MPTVGPIDPILINCGAGTYVDSVGNTWQADQYFTGGFSGPIDTGLEIVGTEDDFLYQSIRYGTSTYNIPVPEGIYNVKLHFAEAWWDDDDVGVRLFDIVIEGTMVANHYDVVVAAGGSKIAHVETYSEVEVTDGSLTIEFVTFYDLAMVSCIQVGPALLEPSPSPSAAPRDLPSAGPSDTPTAIPSQSPSAMPTVSTQPTRDTEEPSAGPSVSLAPSAPPSVSSEPSMVPTVGPIDPILINCGAGTYVDSVGNTWQADQYFTGGFEGPIDTGLEIVGTEDDFLYQSIRYGTSTYNIPVPEGIYNVKLHFAEPWWDDDDVGVRLFDIVIEGTMVANHYDVLVAAGGSKIAHVETYSEVEVTDGSLTIEFVTFE